MRWNLELAIRLRITVREALDRDDMDEVRMWNRVADAAYASLDPFDAIAYMERARLPESAAMEALR